jgi:hypothetical protein
MKSLKVVWRSVKESPSDVMVDSGGGLSALVIGLVTFSKAWRLMLRG